MSPVARTVGPDVLDSRRCPSSRRALLVAVTAASVLLAGCGGRPALTEEPVPDPTPTTTEDARPSPRATERTSAPSSPTPTPEAAAEETFDAAAVARAVGELAVHEAPGDESPTTTLPATTTFGTPTVALVTEVGDGALDGWLEVLLPVRPNGATGWVRADGVDVREVSLEVQVDLPARELVVLDEGEVLLTTPTAIGDPDHPTPTGRFYVTDKLQTPDPSGAYGPFAIGLSAHSDVLTEFAGGDGQVGIHGTNDPTSIGDDVSHGCMRVANDVIEELAHLLPLGTPVTIS